VKYFDWSKEKNQWLIENRDVSFELCVACIEQGYLLDVLQNKVPHEHQRVFIINVEGYAYRIPFVEDEEKIFLKTAYPSKKDTSTYLLHTDTKIL